MADRKRVTEKKTAEKESAVTFDEVREKKQKRKSRIWKVVRLLPFWRKPLLLVAILLFVFLTALPFATYFLLQQGSTFTEQKGAYVKQIQELRELSTAEAYTKVIIERQDNKLFGQSIGLDVPGTKRQLLVVIPGSIKAGVDLSTITEKDIQMDSEHKTAEIILPAASFLGGAELFFDEVEVYSYEGVFREKANIEEAYELAAQAKEMIIEEARGQGVLQTAERNAEKTIREMFTFTDYDVTVTFKEGKGNAENRE